MKGLISNWNKTAFLVNYPWFLSKRKQRVVLNGQNSSWTKVYAGVLQGSILGPLLFSIYVNDLWDSLTCETFSWWCLIMFSFSRSKYFCKRVKRWLEKSSNGKWVSILIQANKPEKLSSVANQRDRLKLH